MPASPPTYQGDSVPKSPSFRSPGLAPEPLSPPTGPPRCLLLSCQLPKAGILGATSTELVPFLF